MNPDREHLTLEPEKPTLYLWKGFTILPNRHERHRQVNGAILVGEQFAQRIDAGRINTSDDTEVSGMLGIDDIAYRMCRHASQHAQYIFSATADGVLLLRSLDSTRTYHDAIDYLLHQQGISGDKIFTFLEGMKTFSSRGIPFSFCSSISGGGGYSGVVGRPGMSGPGPYTLLMTEV